MPSNPLEKQFALLGTAATAGLLDVQKAYRSVFAISRLGSSFVIIFFTFGTNFMVLFTISMQLLT